MRLGEGRVFRVADRRVWVEDAGVHKELAEAGRGASCEQNEKRLRGGFGV